MARVFVETRGQGSSKLTEFDERGDKGDEVLGWQQHPDKGEWAASIPCGKEQWLNWDTIPGRVKIEIKVLEVTHSFTRPVFAGVLLQPQSRSEPFGSSSSQWSRGTGRGHPQER